MPKEIKSSIEKIYGEVKSKDSEDKKIVADISWNDRPAKTEIRVVRSNGNFGSGISLNDNDEIEQLSKILGEIPKEKGNKKEVDFNKLFSNAKEITGKRKQGYLTDNGYIVLTRKKKK